MESRKHGLQAAGSRYDEWKEKRESLEPLEQSDRRAKAGGTRGKRGGWSARGLRWA